MLAAALELAGIDSYTEPDSQEDLTGLVCGSLLFATPSRNPILDALPDVLVLSTHHGPTAAALGPLAQLLSVEAMHAEPSHGSLTNWPRWRACRPPVSPADFDTWRDCRRCNTSATGAC